MLEDELKKTFEELGIHPVPRTFGALDVVRRGQQVKARRRTATVVGSGLGTAALVGAVALSLAFNGQRSEPVTPADPSRTEVTTTTTSPQVTPRPETSPPITPEIGTPRLTGTTADPHLTTTTGRVKLSPTRTTAEDIPRTTYVG